MGQLFWNKIAAVIIGLVLIVMVIRVVGEIVFPEPHGGHAELAYPIDLEAVMGGSHGGAEVEEVVVDLGTLLANASASAGERVFRRCVSCHTAEAGADNLQGPNLWNVVGRAAGSADGFGYSAALNEYGQAWTFENLNGYIENPRAFLPGNSMAFAGIRGEEDRANLLAYMQTLSDNPVAFPAPAAAEETADAEAVMEEGSEAMMDAADEAAADLEDQMQAVEEAAQDTAEDVPGEDG